MRRCLGAARTVSVYAGRRWHLLAFVAILTAYRATQWGHFAVPAPDFFDFEDSARSLARGHLPQQFQRGPLYPALIAVFSPLFGGDRPQAAHRPTLAAAQAVNLVSSAVALLIMYELCALVVGRWALLVVMLSGLHWAMAYVTVHPLVEPTLMTAALAALYLDTRATEHSRPVRQAQGRPRLCHSAKYVAAGLAAAARYDGLCLIAALVLSDLRRRRAITWRVAVAAILAAAPALAWASIGAARAAPNAYAAVMETQAPAGWEFLRSLAMGAMSFVPVQALQGVLAGSAAWRDVLLSAAAASALLAAAGCKQLIRRRDFAVPALGFAGLYVVVHVIYPAANTRFALPVMWLVHLLMVMGGITAGRRVRLLLLAGGWRWCAASAVALGAGAAAVWAARRDAAWVLPLAVPAALAVAGANMGARPLRQAQRLPECSEGASVRPYWSATCVGRGAQLCARTGAQVARSPLATATAARGLAVGARLVAAMPVLALAVASSLGLSGWYLDRESAWWAEMQPVARWCERPRADPARMALTRSALSVLGKLCERPRIGFYDLAMLDPEAPALPADVTHLLWSSTDTPPSNVGQKLARPPQAGEPEACSPLGERASLWPVERRLGSGQAPALLTRRYAEERDRVVPTGRWFVRRVAAGREQAPGGPWRVCARFTARGQCALIYVRDCRARVPSRAENPGAPGKSLP